MKKLSILLAGLLLVAGLATAQTIEERVEALETVIDGPAFAISGYGQVTFGVNIDGGATGFLNATEAKLAVTLYANHAPSRAGTGPVYGEIAFKDVRVFGDSTATTDISIDEDEDDVTIADPAIKARSVFDYARIVAGNLTVTIAGPPEIKLDLEAAIKGANIVAPTAHDGLGTFTALPTYQGAGNQLDAEIDTTGGIRVAYAMPDMATITIGFASVTDWMTAVDVDPQANDYALYAQVEVTAIPDATITLRTLAGLALDEFEYPFGVGAKFEYDLALNGYTLRPIIAVDMVRDADADDFQIAIGNGLRLMWPGPQDFDLPHGYGGKGWSGLTIGYTVLLPTADEDPTLNLHFAVVEDEATGFVPGLGFILAVGIDDVLGDDDLNLGLSTQLSYRVDNITPYVRFAYVLPTEDKTVWAGVKIDPIFPMTRLELAWQSGNFATDVNNWGVFRTILRVSY